MIGLRNVATAKLKKQRALNAPFSLPQRLYYIDSTHFASACASCSFTCGFAGMGI